MSIFSFFHRRKPAKSAGRRRPGVRLTIEPLEDRFLPSTTISGFLYNDADNDGLFQNNETPLSNVTVELVNANNQVIGTTTTNASGFYQFTQDNSINQNPKSITQTLIFPTTETDFSLSQLIKQFDSSLGQLQSVQIIQNGSITSTIEVENTSTTSGATITATVSGDLVLNGPGFTSDLNLQQTVGTFNASVYDGSTDFAGTSGTDFGPQTASGSKTVTLTGSQLAAFIGSGSVTLTEDGTATSSATGGGNLATAMSSNGQANITVVYNYIPSNDIMPGNYTIVLPSQPAGYQPGKESQNGVVLPVPPGTNSIPVTVTAGNPTYPNNDFGELLPGEVSGYVYVDNNDDGIKDNNENGLPGVAVTLTGTNDLGNAVNLSGFTDPNGFYQFNNLRPGTYTVSESPPAGYLPGKVTPGLPGEVAGNNQISSIILPSGSKSDNNDFGELLPASLSGNVYVDLHNDGNFDPGDPGLANVTVTLTGTTDQGNPVSLSTQTNNSGAYQFSNLRPGTYKITETPPAGYADGQVTVGSQGGTASLPFAVETFGTENIFNIFLAMGVAGSNNNFGELQDADLSIVKTANASSVLEGAPLTYTLTVSNNGPSTAQNVVVTDTLPPGATFVSATGAGWNINQSNGVITATMASMASGTTSVITVVIDAPNAVGNITNTATVTSNTPDLTPNNNTSTVTTAVGAEADLSIVKTANQSSVTEGAPLTYTLTVTNNGPNAAQNVVVTDTLPAGAVLVSALGSGWNINLSNGVITATMPSLASGASSGITITIDAPNVAENMTNTAMVISNTFDPTTTDNTSTVTTAVTPPVVINTIQPVPLGPPIFATKWQYIQWYFGL